MMFHRELELGVVVSPTSITSQPDRLQRGDDAR